MSLVKVAHIQDVLTGNTWDGPHGRIFYSTLVLDNGDKGSIGAKTQDKYSIGDSIYYTAEDSDRGRKFKHATPEQVEAFNGNSNGGSAPAQSNPQPTVRNGSRGPTSSFALSYAKDLMIAAMPHHADVTTNQWIEATMMAATKFNNWLKENE
jgi:hypothetical protein